MRIGFLLFSMVAAFMLSAETLPVVSVDPFEPQAGSNVTSAHAERVTNAVRELIENSHRFEVVERARLKLLMEKTLLTDAGLTEGDAPESNRLKAERYAIYGTLFTWTVKEMTIDGDYYIRVEIKGELCVADVETGVKRYTKALTGKAVRQQINRERLSSVRVMACEDALRDLATQMANALLDRVYPIKIAAVNEKNLSVTLAAAQTHIGERFDVYLLGDPITHPDTQEVLGTQEDYIGRVEVIKLGEKLSLCKPCDGSPVAAYDRGMLLQRIVSEDGRPVPARRGTSRN